MRADVIVLGAGQKAEHFVALFNLWENLLQFYEHPYHEHELKRGYHVETNIIRVNRPLETYSAVGDCRDKYKLIKHFEDNCKKNNIPYYWGKRIHRTCVVTNPYAIGDDFIMRELSSIGTGVKIGDHVSVGPLVNLSHNSTLGNYVTIGGQAAISGSVHIGEGVFIGQGAVFKPSVSVGEGAVIGCGAVVVKDVPPDTVVAGNPAKSNPRFKSVEKWTLISS